MAGIQQPRSSSPPPSYEQAITDQPPPYTEYPDRGSLNLPHARTQQPSRFAPIVTNQVGVIVNQPRQNHGSSSISRAQDETATSQSQQHVGKKTLGCNCLCSACTWTPCTCDCELFCFNCLGFLSYLLLCAPGVYTCWGCKRICPETCGECPARDSNFFQSYEEREEHPIARCCCFFVGPCCCFTCGGDKEVCPLSESCVNRFGVRSVLKKMTCYCGSYRLCDYKLNAMDEQAVGFICDCKEVGCVCG